MGSKTKRGTKTGGRSLGMYKTYNFLNKDPVIDEIRTKMSDSQMSPKRVSELSGISLGTLRNWDLGKTKKPQFATVCAAMGAMGYEPGWKRKRA